MNRSVLNGRFERYAMTMAVLWVFVVLFFTHPVYCQPREYNLSSETFGIEDGLPHREVNTILQDSRGYVWFGTPLGISRFDGHRFVNFNSKTDSFQNQNIWKILEDGTGYFWLLPQSPTDKLDLWNPVSRTLTSFRERYGISTPMSGSSRDFWCYDTLTNSIVTNLDLPARLVFYQPGGTFKIIPLEEGSEFKLITAGEQIWGVLDRSQLVQINRQGTILKRFVHEAPITSNPTIGNQTLPFVYWEGGSTISEVDHVWIVHRDGSRESIEGTHYLPGILNGNENPAIGIDLLLDSHPHAKSLPSEHFINPFEGYLRPENMGRSLLMDNQGNVWTGGNFGISRYRVRKNIFHPIAIRNKIGSYSGNAVRGITRFGDKIVFNIEHLGPSYYDLNTKQIGSIAKLSKGFGYTVLCPLHNGTLLVGHQRQMLLLDPDLTLFQKIPTGRTLWSVLVVDNDEIWLGTDKGLAEFNPITGKISPISESKVTNKLDLAYIGHLSHSIDGNIWCGTDRGLFLLSKNRQILAHYSTTSSEEYQIPFDMIHHMSEGSDGVLWLATGGGGLIRIVPGKGREGITQYTQEEGLTNENLYSVYPDDKGKIWMSSDLGIICLDPVSDQFSSWTETNGISHNEFNRLAHFKDTSGILYLGGLNGITAFHPDDLLPYEGDLFEPSLVIVSYQQFDGSEDRMVDRTQQILASQSIILHPNDRFFRVQLALLSFHEVKNHSYAYLLEGVDQEWNETDERVLRFGRLPFGKYNLRIRARDEAGRWSGNEIALHIIAKKPFYYQTWFLLLIGFLLIGSILLYFHMRTRQLQSYAIRLEEEVAQRTDTILRQSEELKSLEKLKSRFFANVSHELRTPLTLMLGPTASLLKREYWKDQDRRLLQFIQKHAKHLLRLVNEILDLSKLETGQLEVNESAIILDQFMEPIVAQFRSFGDSEIVDVTFNNEVQPGMAIYLDTNKVEKVLNNFLSNAIKFTPAKGTVDLTIKEDGDFLLAQVSDTGSGIHPDDLPFIFDRFYQSKQPHLEIQGGTGIGLSLCKELAEVLEGQVWAESKFGKGSVFYFRFPKKVASLEDVDLNDQLEKEIEVFTLNDKPDESALHSNEGPQILIVEDNPDLRDYLVRMLEKDYQVTSAEHGKEAWDILCKEDRPELIISDLMMPVMDGFKLLELIKGKDQLRHIPVIMLTARADVRVKLRALRTGVDDYLIKPFHEEELQARIINLLDNYRERVENHEAEMAFKEEVGKSPQDVLNIPVIGEADSEWLTRVETAFTKYIPETSFTVDRVASELFLSPRQFTRKLKKLTGLTPNHYLREMRLQHARDLLSHGRTKSIKETSYAVGFHDTKYFSSLFQDRFGIPPSESMM